MEGKGQRHTWDAPRRRTLQEAGEFGVSIRDKGALLGFVSESADHVAQTEESFVDVNSCPKEGDFREQLPGFPLANRNKSKPRVSLARSPMENPQHFVNTK